MIHPDSIALADDMLEDLRIHKLEVIMIANGRGGYMRKVVNHNPEWYRALCARVPSHRKKQGKKFKTAIKRAQVLRALRKLKDGTTPGGRYGDRLLWVIGWLVGRAGERLGEKC